MKIFDFLNDNVVLIVSADSVELKHTHWNQKRLDKNIEFSEVLRISGVMIEPYTIQLIFHLKNGDTVEITDEMKNWKFACAAVERYFSGFSLEFLEASVMGIGNMLQCWPAPPTVSFPEK